MKLPTPLAIAIRTLADWLDDRLTLAAVGLATGYFGLGQPQWDSLTSLIVAAASLALVIIPDPRLRTLPDASPQAVPGAVAADSDPDAVRPAAELRLPADRRPHPARPADARPGAGFGDRD